MVNYSEAYIYGLCRANETIPFFINKTVIDSLINLNRLLKTDEYANLREHLKLLDGNFDIVIIKNIPSNDVDEANEKFRKVLREYLEKGVELPFQKPSSYLDKRQKAKVYRKNLSSEQLEKRKQFCRQYYQKNKEKFKAAYDRHLNKNRERVMVINAITRYSKSNFTSERVKKLLNNILKNKELTTQDIDLINNHLKKKGYENVGIEGQCLPLLTTPTEGQCLPLLTTPTEGQCLPLLTTPTL